MFWVYDLGESGLNENRVSTGTQQAANKANQTFHHVYPPTLDRHSCLNYFVAILEWEPLSSVLLATGRDYHIPHCWIPLDDASGGYF